MSRPPMGVEVKGKANHNRVEPPSAKRLEVHENENNKQCNELKSVDLLHSYSIIYKEPGQKIDELKFKLLRVSCEKGG